MFDFAQLLVNVDHDAMRATTALRWEPLTALLTIASLWWVKGPLVVAVAWSADLRRRRILPWIALAATASFLLASALNALLKGIFERSRPPVAMDFNALVSVPSSPSFPSGHAMTAFAAATAVAVLAPRLRWPMLGLAAVIGFSRVYLGVHFWFDVIVGGLLGLAIGAAIAWPLRDRCRVRPAPAAAAA